MAASSLRRTAERHVVWRLIPVPGRSWSAEDVAMLRIPTFAAAAGSAANLAPPQPAEAAILRRRLEELEGSLRQLLAERDRVRAALAAMERPVPIGSPFLNALAAIEDPTHELDDAVFLTTAKLAAGEVPRHS